MLKESRVFCLGRQVGWNLSISSELSPNLFNPLRTLEALSEQDTPLWSILEQQTKSPMRFKVPLFCVIRLNFTFRLL